MRPIKDASITKLRQHPRQAAIMALVSGGREDERLGSSLTQRPHCSSSPSTADAEGNKSGMDG